MNYYVGFLFGEPKIVHSEIVGIVKFIEAQKTVGSK